MLLTKGLAAALALSAVPCAALELDLPSSVKVDDAEFRFTVNPSDSVATLPFSVDDDDVVSGSTTNYLVYSHLRDIKPRHNSYRFRYLFYVVPKANKEEVTRFAAFGRPGGPFLDRWIEVDFGVGPRDALEPGKIRLPILSFKGEFLEFVPMETVKVNFASRGKPVDLKLKSKLEDLETVVTWHRQPKPEDNTYWKSLALKVDGEDKATEFSIAPGEQTSVLTLQLQPNLGQAFAASSFPLAKEHDRVTVFLDYQTRWGWRRSLEVPLAVRFVPWPPVLFLAVAAGTLFGSALLALAKKNRKEWMRVFLVSLMTALLAELIAMFLKYNNSEVRLLGFDLDPFELLPAFLIGVLMGLLGLRSLRKLKQWFPSLFDSTATGTAEAPITGNP